MTSPPLQGIHVRSQGLYKKPDLPGLSPYFLVPGIPSPGAPSLLRHPIGINGFGAGQECLPAVHRLRLSASP